MRISKDRLRRLNKVWEQSSDGLTLLEFTKLMILEVPSVKEEKLEMINALIRLFRQVDINGDEKMEWSEFVQYMIDQVKTESIVATKDMQGNNVTIADKIRMQQAGRFHKIKRSGRPMDKGRHKHTMLDVIKCVDTKNKAKTVIMHSRLHIHRAHFRVVIVVILFSLHGLGLDVFGFGVDIRLCWSCLSVLVVDILQ